MLGKTALRLVGTGAETTGEGMVAIAGGHSVTCMQGGGRNGAEATPAPGKDSRDRDPPHTHTQGNGREGEILTPSTVSLETDSESKSKEGPGQ